MGKYLTTKDVIKCILSFFPLMIVLYMFLSAIGINSVLFAFLLSILFVYLLMKLKAQTNKEKNMMIWEAKKEVEKRNIK